MSAPPVDDEKVFAVTALGAVTCLGTHPGELWGRLVEGASGAGPLSLFEAPGPGPYQACEVRGFDAGRYLGPKGLRSIDRAGRLALVACSLVLSRLEPPLDPAETGVVLGTGFGSVHSIAAFDRGSLQEDPNYVNPSDFPNTTINAAASQVGIRWGLKGLNCTVSSGFCAGLDAFGCALGYLDSGLCRAALVGGVEELCLESFLGFVHSGLLAPPEGAAPGAPAGAAPSAACGAAPAAAPAAARPFDRGRRGAVLGEGAAVMLLEPAAEAARAGRPVLARVLAQTCGHSGRRGPDRAAMARTLRQALADSGLDPGDIGLVVAGASGSPDGDREEALALEAVFGPGGGRARVWAPKGALGECYGASGALGALLAVLALKEGVVPPTVGFEAGEEPGLRGVSARPAAGHLGRAVVHAFGCDGRSSALVLAVP